MNRIALNALATMYLLFYVIDTNAQTSFKPENLGKNVNTEYSEINPVISWDGKTLFFNRVNHPENTFGKDNSQDVWYSSLQSDGNWSPAKRLSESVNISRFNAILSAMEDGRTYFILGRYNRAGTVWLTRGFSVIESYNVNEWSKPKALKIKGMKRVNKGKVVSAFMTPNRELIFFAISRTPNSSRLSLYVSKRKKENSYSKPKSISGGSGGALNPRNLEAPFLTSDMNRLYFSADYGEGRNNFNIYYAERADDKYRKWGVPIKASDTINTPNWDSYFKMNAKGSWAYYSSSTNSFGKADIFRIKLFEERPYVKLTGLILNQSDQKLMLQETDYNILVNGQVFWDLKVNKASASYEVNLPLGRLYTFQPKMENWNGISSSIDLRGVREYSEAKLNLYFSSIPYTQIKGRVIDTRTDEMVPLTLSPKVLINGQHSDSIVYDQFSGAFRALLPLGEFYTFTADINNFTSTSVDVDVTKENTFVERDISIYVTSVPWVDVSGQVLDNNSLTAIPGDAQPQLLINGELADSVFIDPVTGTFKVRLPFGSTYSLGVKAINYNTLENTLDLTSYFQYANVKQNVFAEREDANMVTLSGKFINTKTGKQLEENYEVKFRVNGLESRAFVYDPKNASYTLRLPVGFNYDLTPSVINFYNRFEPVDLTKAVAMAKIVRNFYVTPIEVGQSIDIENIYFETGRARLKPESFRSLNALIEFLNEYPNVRVEIGGHTDNVGSEAVNQKISEDRARMVAQYVIDQGISAERVISRGFGLSKPKASNRTAEGRAQNRRVDFTIVGI